MGTRAWALVACSILFVSWGTAPGEQTDPVAEGTDGDVIVERMTDEFFFQLLPPDGVVTGGDQVIFGGSNGVPDQRLLVGLVAPGLPIIFDVITFGRFDSQGEWRWRVTVPVEMFGISLSFRIQSRDEFGNVVETNDQTLTIL